MTKQAASKEEQPQIKMVMEQKSASIGSGMGQRGSKVASVPQPKLSDMQQKQAYKPAATSNPAAAAAAKSSAMSSALRKEVVQSPPKFKQEEVHLDLNLKEETEEAESKHQHKSGTAHSSTAKSVLVRDPTVEHACETTIMGTEMKLARQAFSEEDEKRYHQMDNYQPSQDYYTLLEQVKAKAIKVIPVAQLKNSGSVLGEGGFGTVYKVRYYSHHSL